MKPSERTPSTRGRKPVSEEEETVTVSLRMTPGQRAKLKLLGGAPWVRKLIDRAKPPKPPE